MDEPPPDASHADVLVWADALQQRGDPRGELIALAEHPAKRDAFVREHADALLGRTVGRHVRKGKLRVTRWRRCYPDAVEIRIDNAAEGPQLVVDAHRVSRDFTITGVTSADGPDLDLTTTLGWLRECELELTALAFVDERARDTQRLVSRNREPGRNLVSFGPLATLWGSLPMLERLQLVVGDPGQLQLVLLHLPALRSFSLQVLAWSEGLCALLANARWPQLRSFELRVVGGWMTNMPDDTRAYRAVYGGRSSGDFGGNAFTTVRQGELVDLLGSLARVPLERLALTSARDAETVLDALDAVSLSTLRELDLSDSAFDVRDAERLARTPWAHALDRIILERVRLPSPRHLGALAAKTTHSCSPAAPTYRYIVGME